LDPEEKRKTRWERMERLDARIPGKGGDRYIYIDVYIFTLTE